MKKTLAPHKTFIKMIWHLPTHTKNVEFQRLLRKLERTKDDRSYVLTSALVLEYRLEQLLSKLLPGYGKRINNNSFSLSQKIKIAQASELIPNEVFEAAIIVRDIRNEFAHNIKVETLGKISKKQRVKLELISSKYSFSKKRLSIRKKYENIAFNCIREVGLYQMNIEYLRWIIKQKEFKNYLYKHWPKYERLKKKSFPTSLLSVTKKSLVVA